MGSGRDAYTLRMKANFGTATTTEGGEFKDGPSSPASTQYFEEAGEESSTESKEMDLESNSERKRKRGEEGNDEEDDDA